MAKLRRREATRAAGLLRVRHLAWLGLREGAWEIGALVRELVRLLDEWRPHLIYAPSRVDFHPEHHLTAHALGLALSATRVGANVRVYQVQVPLTARLLNRVVDVSAVQAECAAALSAYASQTYSIKCTHRMRRHAARCLPQAVQAEAFWEMLALDYVALHRSHPDTWARAFRGLRYSPLTDALAYWAGRGERERLARTLSERLPLRVGLG